jgi:hypothetical protein
VEERVEALELGLTQLADAVETLVLLLQGTGRRLPLEPVLEQVANARRLIGTDEGVGGVEVAEPDFGF